MAEILVNQAFKDVVLRHKIATEQTTDILKRMQLNSVDSPSDAQLKGFEEICKLLESGMEISLAIQTVKNTTRDAKAKKQSPEFVAEDNALAKQDSSAIRETRLREFNETVPGNLKDAITGPVIEDVLQTVHGLPMSIAGAVDEVKTPIMGGIGHYVQDTWLNKLNEELQNPETLKAIGEALKGKHQTSSPTSSSKR